MQVFQLIEMLEYMDPNAEVHFSYNYGDHWSTQVAPVVDTVEQGTVQYSDYHRMDKIVDEDDMHEEDGDCNVEVRHVVVLG